MQEFWTQNKHTRTEHIRDIRLAGDRNNNRMKRLNGELRQKVKVMRTSKRSHNPIPVVYQIYHNYIRQHGALNGKTPSQAAGIEIKGNDKWRTIIQSAHHPRP